MNTSVVGPNGALLLEPDKQLVLNVKMVGSEEPIPISLDTSQEKIQGIHSKHLAKLRLQVPMQI